MRNLECVEWRIDANMFGQQSSGFDRYIFEFVGDQLEATGKFFERCLIGVISSDALGDAAYGSLRRGIEKTKMQAERIAGEREHVAELPAAKDTDGHARFPFFLNA